ncbi:MAG: anti-sigma factor [Ilumatobacter sp.]|nr:anti-sigma factor [Ilumatobacter sp.]
MMNDPDDRVRHLLRDVTPDDARRTAPPPAVWDAIAAEVGHDARADTADATDETVAGVVAPIPLRARHRWSWTLGAAAVLLVAIGAAVIIDARRADAPDLIAAVDVTSEGLPDAPAGIATRAIIEETGGVRRVALDVSGVDVGADEFLELWLINDDITDMVSLGVVRNGGTFEIPAEVELADFPIIDVSVEPDDGVPTHSGRSVLRGRLEA